MKRGDERRQRNRDNVKGEEGQGQNQLEETWRNGGRERQSEERD